MTAFGIEGIIPEVQVRFKEKDLQILNDRESKEDICTQAFTLFKVEFDRFHITSFSSGEIL